MMMDLFSVILDAESSRKTGGGRGPSWEASNGGA